MSGDSSDVSLPSEATRGQTVARRNPWIAALLSALWGTVGQVYCGRLPRAAVLAGCGLAGSVLILTLAVYVPIGLAGMIALAVTMVAWRLFLVIDAAVLTARRPPQPRVWSQSLWFYFCWYFAVTGATLVVALMFRSGCGAAYSVPSDAMADTILAGDQIMVEKLLGRLRLPAHGDVVAHYAPGRDGELWVKRVIGLPGDVIAIENDQVVRNGQRLDEPYAKFVDADRQSFPGFDREWDQLRNFGPVTVPAAHIFTMGDNRHRSRDSRLEGFVPIASIKGRATVIYWSTTRPDRDPFLPPDAPRQPEVRWDRIGRRIR